MNSINNYNYLINNNKTIPESQRFTGNTVALPSKNQTILMSQNASNALKAGVLAQTPIPYSYMGVVKFPFCNDAQYYQLANGQRVIIMPKKGPVTMKTFVRAGAMNEPDRVRGISHYIEHNLFNGSANLAPSEFVEKVNSRGASYNASTGFMKTDYFIKTPLHKDDDFDKLIEIHADMLTNPSFLDAQLAKEKSPVISEIQMYQDSPSNIAINELYKNLFNIQTKCKDLVAGSKESIGDLTRQDVLDYYNTWYTPDNMTTIIVGDIKPEEAMSKISTLFNKYRPIQPQNRKYEEFTQIQKTVRKDITFPNIDTTSVLLAFSGPKNNDINNSAGMNVLLKALCGLRNNRMNTALKSFNTEASADIDVVGSKFNDPQAIVISANFDEGKEQKGMETIYSVIESFKTTPITDEEMYIIKNQLKESLSQASESSFAITDLLGTKFLEHGTLNYYNDALKIVDSMLPTDVQKLAIKYLDLNKASIVVMHPEKKPANISFTGNIQKPVMDVSGVKQYDLPTNARLVLHDDKESDRTNFTFSLECPEIKDIKPGLLLVMNEMFKKGSSLHSEEELNRIKDINSIGVYAAVSSRGLTVGGFGRADNTTAMANLAREILFNPSFTQKNLNEAIEKIKLDVKGTLDSAYDEAMAELYPNDPRGYTKEVILKNIDSITLNDVKNLYAGVLADSQGLAIVSAPISKNPHLANIIASAVEAMPAAKPYKFNFGNEFVQLAKNTVVTKEEDRKQAHIVQAFKFYNSGNIQDKAAAILLNEILGGNSSSRLFSDLREKQKLAYRVKSSIKTNENNGDITLEIKTTTKDKNNPDTAKNIQRSLDGFKFHITKLMNEPVTQSELDAIKLSISSNLKYMVETSSGRNDLVSAGLNSHYGVNYGQELMNAVNNTTTADIQKAAQLFFSQPSVVSIIADKSAIDANSVYLKTLGEIKST